MVCHCLPLHRNSNFLGGLQPRWTSELWRDGELANEHHNSLASCFTWLACYASPRGSQLVQHLRSNMCSESTPGKHLTFLLRDSKLIKTRNLQLKMTSRFSSNRNQWIKLLSSTFRISVDFFKKPKTRIYKSALSGFQFKLLSIIVWKLHQCSLPLKSW